MKIKVSPKQQSKNKPMKPGEFTNLPAGGYVCKIVDVDFTESKAGNDMLVLHVDIAEGDFKGYFQNFADRFKNWSNNAAYRQLMWDDAGDISGFFNGLMKILEDSNAGFVAYQNGEYDTETIKGKLCGFVFADEEYQKNNGDIATRAVVRIPKTVAEIRDGDFTVPPLKKMDPSKIKPKTNSDDVKKSDSPSPLEDPPF